MVVGDFPQGLVGGALPEQVHCDNALGLGAHEILDAFGVDLERFRVDVGKNGDAPQFCHAFRRSDKGKVRNDDLVPRFKAQDHEGNLDGLGAAPAGDRLDPSAVGGQLPLQGLDLRSADVATAVKYCFFGFFQLLPVGVSLGREVHKGHHNGQI